MSAKERREHLERAVAEGGTIMTARGAITRTVPSTSSLASTPEEKRAAREDLERRYRALREEARLLEDDEEDDSERVARAQGISGDDDETALKEGGLESHTVAELREIAREKGIEGYSGLNKADLIAAIEEKA